MLAGIEQLPEGEQHLRPAGQRDVPPLRPRRSGGRDDGIRVLPRGQRNELGDLPGRRVVDVRPLVPALTAPALQCGTVGTVGMADVVEFCVEVTALLFYSK